VTLPRLQRPWKSNVFVWLWYTICVRCLFQNPQIFRNGIYLIPKVCSLRMTLFTAIVWPSNPNWVTGLSITTAVWCNPTQRLKMPSCYKLLWRTYGRTREQTTRKHNDFADTYQRRRHQKIRTFCCVDEQRRLSAVLGNAQNLTSRSRCSSRLSLRQE